jgi:hypothetical protein
MTTTPSSTESRALTLLGQGLPISTVAAALGVTDSAISQLLSNPSFSQAVRDRKYQALAKYQTLDDNYDALEAKLQKQLMQVVPMLFKPRDVLHAIQVVNAAKRRGGVAPDATPDQAKVVTITMPTVISQKFITNIHQQVIQAGSQDLTTIPSSQISRIVDVPTMEIPNEPPQLSAPETSQSSGS